MPEQGLVSRAERRWATLAHLSALLTAGLGLWTGGAGGVLALLLPLGLYVYFRERAPYVAFHALQSTVFQAAGAITLVVGGVAAALGLMALWLLTAGLSVVIVGLLLLPFTFTLTVMAVLAGVGLPVTGLAYVLRGAYQSYHGERFEYPLVGALVTRTMMARG
jgi:uncharacterized Tic20 family protein